MKEEKGVTSYYKFIIDIIALATLSWQNGEGFGEWRVSNDKGFRQAKIDGSATKRFSDKTKKDDGDE